MTARTDRGYYQLDDGRRYVRVSTVLGTLAQPSLAKWRGAVGNEEADRISRAATDRGTALHALLEGINRASMGQGEPPPKPLDGWLRKAARSYCQWLDAEVAEVVDAERFVCSEPNGYAGTLDALLRLKSGELAVCDFKSNKWREPSETHSLQLVAYALALREAGDAVQRRLVLQFPSDAPGELLMHDYREHERDEHGWRALLAVWHWRQGWNQQRAERRGSTLTLRRVQTPEAEEVTA